jgi:hypothetical protein
MDEDVNLTFEGNEENHSKNKFFLVAIVLIFIAIFVVLFGLFSKSKETVKPILVSDLATTTEPKNLSSEELENERFLLPPQENVKIASSTDSKQSYGQTIAYFKNASSTSSTSESISTSTSRIIEENMAIYNSLPKIEVQPLVTDKNIKTEEVEPVEKIEDSSSVTFGKVTITSVADSEELVEKTISGVVLSVNAEKNYFNVVIENKGIIKVDITESTKFVINSLNFLLKDLKNKDLVTIEGMGKPSSDRIIAETVTITGVLDIKISM